MNIFQSRMEELYTLIERHARLYYDEDSPEISDSEYDSLVRELSQLEKDFPEFSRKDFLTHKVGGSPSNLFAPVTHKIPMLSLDNVFDNNELEDFFTRIPNENLSNYVCEMKIDGLAVSLIYEDGKFIQGATRGDGKTGEDVTENLRAIKSIPEVLVNFPSGRVEIRGEVLMTLDSFNKLNSEREENGENPFANPRNAAAGSLRQSAKNNDIISKRGLDFFAYYLVEAENFGIKTQNDALNYISEMGLPVQKAWKTCENLNEVFDFINHWHNERFNLNYVTDGVVVKINDLTKWNIIGATSHAPRWAIAFKYPPEEALSKILDIKISIGRTGVLTPVAILEPVRLAGTLVKRAGLHNFDEIQRKDIRIFDTVRVRKAAEIIPEVISVEKNSRSGNEKIFKIPTHCPACNSEIVRLPGEVAFRCPNRASCPAQLKESIKYFASRDGMNIKGIGNRLSLQLVENGRVKILSDIYELKVNDISGFNRMGVKLAQKILDEIQASKNRPLASLIAALGIRYIGKNAAELLAHHFKSIDTIKNADESEIADINGIGAVSAKSVKSFFDDEANLELLRRFKALGIKMNDLDKDSDNVFNGKLSGKTFVFTGTLLNLTRDDASNKVKSLGANVSNSVSSKTDYVVAGDKPGSKYDKALKLGITILNEQEFFKLLADNF